MLAGVGLCVAAATAWSKWQAGDGLVDVTGLSLEQAVKKQFASTDAPGAVVGVYGPDGKVVLELALGVADVDTREPLTIDHHMRIASVTKMFVGTAILLLADEGLLSLDDPISKYVDGVPRGDEITLRMLGRHTSGLFNSIENQAFQRAIMAAPDYPWSPEEILAYAYEKTPYAAPGERWRYSNSNAILLGMACEKTTGTAIADVVRDRVLAPLGLGSTGFPPADGTLPTPSPSAYRNGYPTKVLGYGDTWYDVTGYSGSWTGAAGDMYSTVRDLGRAAETLATGTLLSESSRAELAAWQPTPLPGADYSFMLARRDGAVGHTGDVPGFNAFTAYVPEADLSVVVLTNLSNNADGTMPAEAIAKIVVSKLLESARE
ncbi:MAG: serine hydrolase domain-containing protein [Planctomycetota bacterium]